MSQPSPDPDNLEGSGRTREEMAAAARELDHIAPTPADKFALMFGKSERPTPLTDALWIHCVRNPGPGSGLLLAAHARRLERQLAEAREALEKIEERYIDGEDTYVDWKHMGTTARDALAQLDEKETP